MPSALDAPHVFTVGNTRFVTVEAVAKEFKTTPEVVRKTLRQWKTPPLHFGGAELIALYTLERELLRRTARLADPSDESELSAVMTRIAAYHPSGRRRAIIEAIRDLRPAWERDKRRKKPRSPCRPDASAQLDWRPDYN